jgi:hypothetical protein
MAKKQKIDKKIKGVTKKETEVLESRIIANIKGCKIYAVWYK